MTSAVRTFLTVLLLGFVATSAACLDPCDRLATRICECEDSDLARETCRQRVELQKENLKPSEANKQSCEAALDTCNCAALDRLNLAACGFSR